MTVNEHKKTRWSKQSPHNAGIRFRLKPYLHSPCKFIFKITLTEKGVKGGF